MAWQVEDLVLVFFLFLLNPRWVFPKNRGKTPKWMVKIMENRIKMDDLGVPPFSETPRWWQIKYFWNFHPDPWGNAPI